MPAAATLLLAAWAMLGLPRRPAASFLILAFLLLLAPTSSILPVQDVCGEHRMYLGLALDRLGDPRGEALLRTAVERIPDSMPQRQSICWSGPVPSIRAIPTPTTTSATHFSHLAVRLRPGPPIAVA